MATEDKDFKVKNGLQVGGDGIFDGAVTADALQLDLTLQPDPAVGKIAWNVNDETIDIGLNEDITLQVGQEQLIRVKNASGTTAIPKFTFVMFAGATGDTVSVAPAITDGTIPPEYMVGITTQTIPADDFGFVTQFGFINRVNTSALEVGDLLYPSPTTPGGFTTTRPAAPAFDVAVAAVTRKNANSGRILVRMANGLNLQDVHNVQITNPQNGQSLVYEDGIWINDLVSGGGSITVSDTPPEGASEGDLWYDSTDAAVYIYYDGFWVDVSSGPDEVDLTDYATKQYVDDAIDAIPAVDLTGYATETYVNEKIDEIDVRPQIFMLMGA